MTLRDVALALHLAWRDLWHDRFFLVCNAAVLVGVVVPLMVLYGVKNGVSQALLDDLLSNPSVLQIDTLGNKSFTQDQLDEILAWPEVAFAAPRARSAFDSVNLRRDGGRHIVAATLLPSGAGDPNLPPGLDLPPGTIALTEVAAGRLEAGIGDTVDIVGQIEAGQRDGNLRVQAQVVHIVPSSRIDGASVLGPFALVDGFEALYEGYAVPQFGLDQGLPADTRVPAFEGVRVFARDLSDVVALETRLGATLDVGTRGSSADIAALFGLSRNLTLVFGITAALAALGLGAALVTGSYADVVRKRLGLASLSMLGLPGAALALIPVLQALFTAMLGLAVAFPAFWIGAAIIDSLFGQALPGDNPVAFLRPLEALALFLGVLVLSMAAAGAAARSAIRIDPASVLREGQ